MKKKWLNIPKYKKDIGYFLASEEAKIINKKAIKAGAGLIAASFILGPSVAQAHLSYTSNGATDCGGDYGCHVSHGSHGSHVSHASHASHSNHTSHASHSSHSSHGSHASHGSHGSHSSHSSHSSY